MKRPAAKKELKRTLCAEPIKSWPAKERPRERLLADGPARLSDAELLAVILRVGSGSFKGGVSGGKAPTISPYRSCVNSGDSAGSIAPIKDLIKNKVDINNLSADDLGVFASTERNLHLLTNSDSKSRHH